MSEFKDPADGAEPVAMWDTPIYDAATLERRCPSDKENAIAEWLIHGGSIESWDALPAGVRDALISKAREAKWSRSPALDAPTPPAGKCVADRLTAYRCAVMTGLLMRTAWRDRDVAVGEHVERVAHAMLAAERPVTP